MPPRFLDTNILLRYLTRDDEEKAHRALALLLRVERGEEEVVTSPMVVFETIFTLQSYYRLPKERIRERVGDLLSLRSLHVPDKQVFLRALDLYVRHNISFADAYNAASMHQRQMTEIYSWDTDFDKLPGITRVEPDA